MNPLNPLTWHDYSSHYDPYFKLRPMNDIPPHKDLNNEVGEIKGEFNENNRNPHTSEIFSS